jgi:carboxypeptidase PM20D1
MRKILIAALAAAAVAGVVLVRAASMESRQIEVAPAPAVLIDEAAAAGRLAAAVRFRTVSADTGSAAELARLHAWLAGAFPRVHAALGREVVGGGTLLYAWPGTDPSLAPLLLMAHLDVVPVDSASASRWTHPPFDGAIAEGHVWGRGTMDDKGAALAILEAVEMLLEEGSHPSRTVLLSFGHDEEIGGEGARGVARLLGERRIRPGLVVDEGSVIAEGIFPGLEPPVALVGIAEKGSLSLELVAEAPGGHSSMPPRGSAIPRLAKAIAALEREPFPGGIRGPTRAMLDYLGPELPFGLRIVFGNLWLFGPLVERRLAADPASDALLRTTTAVTIVEGGVKENVLPTRARAVVNHRILPGDSMAGVEARVRALAAREDVRIRRLEGGFEPSPVSRIDSWGFAALARTVREVFPDAVVAPYLTVGATDARHLAPVAGDVVRFSPLRATSEDLERIHGIDERVAVAAHADAIRFYRRLLLNAAGEARLPGPR